MRPAASDHMQQHSGQHVLSQAFVELFNWPTVSFHLGAVTCTIDLPAEAISREQAEKAEELANRIVRENRNVARSLHCAGRHCRGGTAKTDASGPAKSGSSISLDTTVRHAAALTSE